MNERQGTRIDHELVVHGAEAVNNYTSSLPVLSPTGRGKEASARHEKSMADAKVRHKAEASVSNPLAIDGGKSRKEP